jgi:SRSO17 transposase
VASHYADDLFEWPIAARLFLPREWTDDAERRLAARIPDDVDYRSPAEIALGLTGEARAQGLPVTTLVADAHFGEDAEFLDGLDAAGRAYMVERSTLAGIETPALRGARAEGRGGRGAPLLDLARSLPEGAWRRVGWRDAAGRPRVQDFARLAARRDGESAREDGVLLLARPVAGGEPTALYGGGLGGRELDELVRLASRLGAARAFYDGEARGLGLDDYEGRLWAGFNRHVALVFLASAHRLLVHAYGR